MYNPEFLLLELGNASSDAVLHFGVGGSDVLVLGRRVFLHMGFGVRTDAGCAQANIALLWVIGGVPLLQKLEIS
jgi:hypothetical protein